MGKIDFGSGSDEAVALLEPPLRREKPARRDVYVREAAEAISPYVERRTDVGKDYRQRKGE